MRLSSLTGHHVGAAMASMYPQILLHACSLRDCWGAFWHVWHLRQASVMHTCRRGLLLVRGVFGFGAIGNYLWAVTLLPLNDTLVLTFTAPIWAAVLGPYLIKERASKCATSLVPLPGSAGSLRCRPLFPLQAAAVGAAVSMPFAAAWPVQGSWVGGAAPPCSCPAHKLGTAGVAAVPTRVAPFLLHVQGGGRRDRAVLCGRGADRAAQVPGLPRHRAPHRARHLCRPFPGTARCQAPCQLPASAPSLVPCLLHLSREVLP